VSIGLKVFLSKLLSKVDFDLALRSLKIPKDTIETIFEYGSQLKRLEFFDSEVHSERMKVTKKNDYQIKTISFLNCEDEASNKAGKTLDKFRRIAKVISKTPLKESLKYFMVSGSSIDGMEIKEIFENSCIKDVVVFGWGDCRNKTFQYKL